MEGHEALITFRVDAVHQLFEHGKAALPAEAAGSGLVFDVLALFIDL